MEGQRVAANTTQWITRDRKLVNCDRKLESTMTGSQPTVTGSYSQTWPEVTFNRDLSFKCNQTFVDCRTDAVNNLTLVCSSVTSKFCCRTSWFLNHLPGWTSWITSFFPLISIIFIDNAQQEQDMNLNSMVDALHLTFHFCVVDHDTNRPWHSDSLTLSSHLRQIERYQITMIPDAGC